MVLLTWAAAAALGCVRIKSKDWVWSSTKRVMPRWVREVPGCWIPLYISSVRWPIRHRCKFVSKFEGSTWLQWRECLGELYLWYVSHLVLQHCWWQNTGVLVYSRKILITQMELTWRERRKRRKKIGPCPRGKRYIEYLGNSQTVGPFCVLFSWFKKRQFWNQFEAWIRMCATCMSPTCLVGEYIIVVIVQCELWIKFLKGKSFIRIKIFRNVFSLLKSNYQIKIFLNSGGVKCSKFRKPSSIEIIWN